MSRPNRPRSPPLAAEPLSCECCLASSANRSGVASSSARISSAFRRAVARSSALAFFDGYRTERLPANLLQAQRDYFGAHTYERTDKPRGEFFHTNWTGRGGRVSSTTYNA